MAEQHVGNGSWEFRHFGASGAYTQQLRGTEIVWYTPGGAVNKHGAGVQTSEFMRSGRETHFSTKLDTKQLERPFDLRLIGEKHPAGTHRHLRFSTRGSTTIVSHYHGLKDKQLLHYVHQDARGEYFFGPEEAVGFIPPTQKRGDMITPRGGEVSLSPHPREKTAECRLTKKM